MWKARFPNAKEMAFLRTCLSETLVPVVLLVSGTSTAPAQVAPVFQCVANTLPPIVRAEGITELVAERVLNCIGGTPTAAVFTDDALYMLPNEPALENETRT